MTFFHSQYRPATSKVYHSFWNQWSAWCHENGVKDPMKPRASHIANHLAYLAETHGFSATSLKTRRSAIASVLATTGGTTVATDPLITGVLKGIANSRQTKPKFTPQWDLAVVLDFLKSDPMKNNKLLSHDLLTYKTAFLVSLASGRRASEVTNLSGIKGDVCLGPDLSLSLKFLPEFMAKNQTPGDPSPSIVIPPLYKKGQRPKPDKALCPVSALIEYRARSDLYRSPTQRALFISVNKNFSTDITRATLSRWLKSLIRKAYLALSREGRLKSDTPIPSGNFRAHEIRAWAATMASKSMALSDLMKAAYWKSPSVFAKHYLRDVALRSEDGTLRLPAMVAAQTRVPPQN